MSASIVPDINLSQPLAVVLREGTAAVHDELEKSEGAALLARGELKKDEYVRFLMMLWHVYDTLERALETHASHPVLSLTYNPGLLARSANLSADIAFYLQTDENVWCSHSAHVALMDAPPSALTRYLTRIRRLAESQDPSALLAHAYVRYLGDLSGGQIIRYKTIKAYGLTDERGISFYDFECLDSPGPARNNDVKKIKEWYRRNMDSSVGDDEALKATILEEANMAFMFNAGLFASLRPPSVAMPAVLALPPLGEPVTPTTDSHSAEGKSPAKVVYDESTSQATTFQLSSVIAVIAAMSLAHFVLVVGGFTGDRGLAKLEALRDWLVGR